VVSASPLRSLVLDRAQYWELRARIADVDAAKHQAAEEAKRCAQRIVDATRIRDLLLRALTAQHGIDATTVTFSCNDETGTVVLEGPS
jgi:hypothetical protein